MAKLIHLVGPSGTGKSSIHKLLTPLIEQHGYTVAPLIEPGPLREQIRVYRQSPRRNAYTEAVLFSADRALLYDCEVLPRLREQNLVFTFARGLPDSLVYQGLIGGVPPETILELNKHIPTSDLYLALLVDGHVGHERILSRSSQTGEPISRNETPAAINGLTYAYKQLSFYFSNVTIIDTTFLTLEQTTALCMKHILTTLQQQPSL